MAVSGITILGSDIIGRGGCRVTTDGDKRALPPSAPNRNTEGGNEDKRSKAILGGVGVVAGSAWPRGIFAACA